MAFNVNTPEGYGYQVAELFGVPAKLLAVAKAAELSIGPEKNNPLKFLIKAPNNQYSGSVEVKGTAMTLAKAGTMGPASKQAIAAQFTSHIDAAINHCSANPTAIAEEEVIEEIPTSTAAFGKELKMTMTDIKEKDLGMALGESLNKEKVKLGGLVTLGQPVSGTSSQSTYFVVALFAGLNMAIRTKFNKLSVRVEGEFLPLYGTKLKSLGFSVKDDYASIHLEVSNDDVLCKTVGAIVGRLGFDQLKGAISPHHVQGK